MTKLLLNLSVLGPKPTGLGVYATHCADALASTFDLSVVANRGYEAKAHVAVEAPPEVAVGAGKLAAVKRILWSRSLTFDADTLIYSPTHHTVGDVKNQILTIHDLICLRFPAQHKPQYLFFKYVLPRLAKQCRAIFTVSETTKRDVAEHYDLPLDKIFVVPNGVDASVFSPGTESTPPPPRPYLLMVGARYPHKNVQEVLANHIEWADRFRLVIASCGGRYRKQLEQQARGLAILDKIEFLEYVSFKDLVSLYQGASALVYPSYWEGFGIPPLEALASGTEVIASDIAVHREVLADAAIFVKLGDSSSWAAAFAGLADDVSRRDRRSAASRVLQRFTWTRSAQILQDAMLRVEPQLAARQKELVVRG